MPTEQINITLGTAGHIDHGKTVLIKCLTGCDTDRLKVEKQRGMSIELGFAPCTISDLEIGIVDVPGHENFIKTMVAGASAIDGVIFVIAADDGVMPQTREHLDILGLLGVKYGIVALTKVDCVGTDRLPIVTTEVRNFLTGTFLQGAPILPVSGITGQGFGEFHEALKELIETIEPKKTDGVFRMPIERAFSLKGYGTVVAGIPVSGSVAAGDEVMLLPKEIKGRAKAIQVYKRNSNAAVSGQCAAINVPKWDHKTIKRGDVVTVGKYFSPQRWYLCKLNLLDSCSISLKTGTGIKFHTGTSEIVAKMYLLQGNTITNGQQGIVQFRLNEPVVAAPGDRFMLRSLSPVRTVGGGLIVEAIPQRLKRSKPGVLEEALARSKAVATEKDFIEYCVETTADMAANETELLLRAKILPQKFDEIMAELITQNKVIELAPGLFIHSQTVRSVEQQLLNIVRDFHHTFPDSPGVSIDRFYELSKLRKNVFDGLVKSLISKGEIVERKHCLALPDHCESFTEDRKRLLATIETLFSTRLFNPPKLEDIIQDIAAQPQEVQKTLNILIEQEQLVQIEKNLFFHHRAIDKACELLTAFIEKEGKLESVKFKYLLDTTRKFAIPLLDYFDRIGVTRRVGNTRYLKKTL